MSMANTWHVQVGDAAAIPLADNSVDLVVCSPPYENVRDYGIGFNLKGQAWVDWAVARYLECLRVCRGLVAWVVEGKTSRFRWSATPALMMADLHRKGVHLRKPPAYHRVGIPGSGGPDWLRNDYEIIVCATNGGRLPWSENTACGHPPKYGPGGEMSYRDRTGTRRNQWGGTPRRRGSRTKDGGHQKADRPSHEFSIIHTKRSRTGGMVRQSYAPQVRANPGNVISCKVGGGNLGHKLAHENEAPYSLSIAEFFVLSFCLPGGTVLDPFCGSGTTLHAAIKHGRNAIGIDLRQSQCELTRRRLRDVQTEFRWDEESV